MSETDRKYHATVTDPLTGDVVDLSASSEQELDQLVEENLNRRYPPGPDPDDQPPTT